MAGKQVNDQYSLQPKWRSNVWRSRERYLENLRGYECCTL